MSQFSKQPSDLSRRQVLQGALSLAVMCVLDCEPIDLQVPDLKIKKALDDPSVIHGLVEFQGGHEKIGGYLARPNKPGQFPIVLVVTGSSIKDEYIQNTTAMLAQAGFVGFTPDIYAQQRNATTMEENRKILAEKITDDYMFSDLDAAVRFLRTKDYVKPGGIGLTGFCFGGRCALMYSTHCKEVAAIVPFYGNLKTPAFARRKTDPVDVAAKIHAAVQGHYSKSDDEIPLDQLSKFEQELKRHHTRAEFFTYDAPHGFFAYNRSTYNDAAAQESWKRAAAFLRKELGA